MKDESKIGCLAMVVIALSVAAFMMFSRVLDRIERVESKIDYLVKIAEGFEK